MEIHFDLGESGFYEYDEIILDEKEPLLTKNNEETKLGFLASVSREFNNELLKKIVSILQNGI